MLRFQRVVCYSAHLEVRFAASQAAPKKDLSPEEKAIREEKLAVSSFYNSIVYKGRQQRDVGLADLRKLLIMCKRPEHVLYAVRGVEYYHNKKMDFAEDINNSFIKCCVTHKKPEAALPLLLWKKCRIGAWTTPSSLMHLLTSLKEKKMLAELVDVSLSLAPRGVLIQEQHLELVLQASAQHGDAATYDKVVEMGAKHVNETVLNALKVKHPRPEAVEVEQAK